MNTPYVLVSPNGIEYIGLHPNEDAVWMIAMGWPSVEEIDYYKKNSWYVAKATVAWEKP